MFILIKLKNYSKYFLFILVERQRNIMVTTATVKTKNKLNIIMFQKNCVRKKSQNINKNHNNNINILSSKRPHYQTLHKKVTLKKTNKCGLQ